MWFTHNCSRATWPHMLESLRCSEETVKNLELGLWMRLILLLILSLLLLQNSSHLSVICCPCPSHSLLPHNVISPKTFLFSNWSYTTDLPFCLISFHLLFLWRQCCQTSLEHNSNLYEQKKINFKKNNKKQRVTLWETDLVLSLTLQLQVKVFFEIIWTSYFLAFNIKCQEQMLKWYTVSMTSLQLQYLPHKINHRESFGNFMLVAALNKISAQFWLSATLATFQWTSGSFKLVANHTVYMCLLQTVSPKNFERDRFISIWTKANI